MFKSYIPILSILAVLLAACAPQAAPTMSPADVQGTAVSAAWTMVAATQQAIPTNTPPPPTPLPSPTPLPLLPTLTPLGLLPPTFGAFPTNPPVGGATQDPCRAPMAKDAAGPTVILKFQNINEGSANVSMNMNTKTPFGECGSRSLTVKGHSSVLDTTFLAGCYYMYAWVGPPKQSTAEGSACFHGGEKMTVMIRADTITVNYP